MEEKSSYCSNISIFDEKFFPLLDPEHLKGRQLLTSGIGSYKTRSWAVNRGLEILLKFKSATD